MKNIFKARPHPGLLLQEKEQRVETVDRRVTYRLTQPGPVQGVKGCGNSISIPISGAKMSMFSTEHANVQGNG
jgi:hypothetical protein